MLLCTSGIVFLNAVMISVMRTRAVEIAPECGGFFTLSLFPMCLCGLLIDIKNTEEQSRTIVPIYLFVHTSNTRVLGQGRLIYQPPFDFAYNVLMVTKVFFKDLFS